MAFPPLGIPCLTLRQLLRRELLNHVPSLTLMSTLCISSLFGWSQAVLCVHFWAVVLFVALLADVGVALVAVQNTTRPDTALRSRSAILTENDAFLAEEIVVIDLSRWADHLTTEISPRSGVLALTKAR